MRKRYSVLQYQNSGKVIQQLHRTGHCQYCSGLKIQSLFMRKHLAESFIVLSKVNYACSVFHPLLAFQMKLLQRLQNACAGFVTRRLAGVEDVLQLNWLPVNENVELNILKLTHKSLYDGTFPEYLKLNLHKVSAQSLRSSIAPVLSIPRESCRNISAFGSNYF